MREDQRDESMVRKPSDEKRPYHSPVLTEYGSIEQLVDGGVMGLLVLTT